MIVIGIILSFISLGFLCWLLFALAVQALPGTFAAGLAANQPGAEVLDADPLLHRFTVVSDWYSPKFFAKMKKRRIACLSLEAVQFMERCRQSTGRLAHDHA